MAPFYTARARGTAAQHYLKILCDKEEIGIGSLHGGPARLHMSASETFRAGRRTQEGRLTPERRGMEFGK
ncbi:MAG: hypothetical protein F4Y03_01840 [Alphaproteobacteria bacterium]|nr:hypothetical protein [Alphaproteobacteria bacterium]MDE0650761.1 hypothetical protein [Gammaproteobacteria bacterium]MYE00008.1 hypothetical protein [Alphaproteobacteria bacterium]MYE59815.1 hypothetical protein [Alphaproteobacteria bacterium]